MAAQRPAGNDPAKPKAATPKTRQSETELTADWVESLEPAADGKSATKRPQHVQPIAGKRPVKKPAAQINDPFLAEAAAVAAAAKKPAVTTTSGSAASAGVEELSSETLPPDLPVASTTPDLPRPPKPEKKKRVEPGTQAIAEGQAGSAAGRDRLPRGSAHERQRANVLMERAYAMYRSGYPEESLRLASVAAELEKSQQAVYRKGEERPSDFITWLQSADGGRSASPPVIRPRQENDRQTADLLTKPSASGNATTAVATQTKRPLGEILRTEGDSILQQRDSANPRAASSRSNAGMELLASETPRFSSNNSLEQRALANSPQVAAPAPSATRNADAVVATSSSDGPRFDPLATQDAPPPPADAPRTETQRETIAGPALAASEAPVEQSKAADTVTTASSAESETLAEAEAPGLLPGRTTQLTVVGIIGLLTGVAGMAGLSWWHVQERRHYAGK